MRVFIKNQISPIILFRGIFGGCVFLFLFCFLGCVSNFKKIDQRFYLLESRLNQKEEATEKSSFPQIVISDVRLPSYLDRPQIVSIFKKNQLTFSESERWGDSLKKDIVRVLRKNLMVTFPHSKVEAVPHYQRGKNSLFLTIEISSFAFYAGLGKVKLEADWSLVKDNQTLKTYTDSINFPLSKIRNTETVVSRMSDCLAELSNRIATTIKDF